MNARYRRIELLTVDTLSRFALFLLFSLTGLKPAVSLAAPSSATTVISFAGLNERSGVLFVASDQGLFRKYGIESRFQRAACFS